MMDKSSLDTPRKRPVLLNAGVNLQFSHFDPLSPFQCCNHVMVSTERGGGGGGGRGIWLSTKKMLLKLRKEADGKRLFCSNVSTLLSMIAGPKSSSVRGNK